MGFKAIYPLLNPFGSGGLRFDASLFILKSLLQFSFGQAQLLLTLAKFINHRGVLQSRAELRVTSDGEIIV